jgi:hypothetical protein
MRFYPLSCNRASDRRGRKKKRGRKAVAVVAILIVRIYLDLFSSYVTKKEP